jgi:hypothetical protein
MNCALWGAGAYAITESGHCKLGDFPEVTADDLYVDRVFAGQEKEILSGAPVLVRVPRDVRGLMAVLRRSRRGNVEQHAAGGAGSGGQTALELLSSVHGPVSLMDAVVYAGFSLAARLAVGFPRGGRNESSGWERDNSSRIFSSAPSGGRGAGTP